MKGGDKMFERYTVVFKTRGRVEILKVNILADFKDEIEQRLKSKYSDENLELIKVQSTDWIKYEAL